jgi:catechol 2,3-dioxygenase-like lactoylglutathione lyase family enzyme
MMALLGKYGRLPLLQRNEIMEAKTRPFQIVGLNYVSLYLLNLVEAVAFYSEIFGSPEVVDEKGPLYGWKLGSTWLTLFPSKIGTAKESNPCNAEFAIQVAEPGEVDRLYAAFLAAGAKKCMVPEDTEMYEPMRFCCVDDPFGVRIDVYCPIDPPASESAAP